MPITDRVLTKDTFDASKWLELVEACDKKECHAYSHAFMVRSRQLRAEGKVDEAVALQLLDVVCFMALNNDEPSRPITSTFEGVVPGNRSPNPDDLEGQDVNALLLICDDVEDPEIKSRIDDIIWLKRRDHNRAIFAIDAYLASAIRLEKPDHWVDTHIRIERALAIAVQLGRKSDSYKKVIGHIEDLVRRMDGEDPLFLTCKMMELLINNGEGDGPTNAALAEKAAVRHQKMSSWHVARAYWEVCSKWHRLNSRSDEEREALINMAECHVQEAEERIKKDGSYLAASTFVMQAIEAYRQIGDSKEKIEDLHRRLLEYQSRIRDEFEQFSAPIEVTDSEEAAVKRVKGLSFPDAIIQLALITNPPSVAFLEQKAKELASTYVLTHLLGSWGVDEHGRTVSRKPSMLSSDPKEQAAAIEAEMFEYARMAQHVKVVGSIDPARRQIVMGLSFRLYDMYAFLILNPLVRRGREEILARGLYYGLQGDFMLSTHLLLPQLEDILRYSLMQCGCITSKCDHRGIQDELSLNRLFEEYQSELERIFGKDMVFDLRGLLIDRFGSNLRNAFSHGLLSAGSFQTPVACYLWWIVLRLICSPIILARMEQEKAGGEQKSRQENDSNTHETDAGETNNIGDT